MMDGFGLGGGMFGMGLWWLLLIAALGALIVFALRRGSNPPTPRDSARDILDKRYARGEIGADEYESKKRDLPA